MIYALLDQDTLHKKKISLQDYLRKLHPFSIPILQYRSKSGSISEKREALKIIRANYDGKLIINDTVELIAYADGVHLGQDDIRHYDNDKREAVRKIRQLAGRKILGLSTHNAAEVEEANDLDLDYVGLGAYRPTGTKKDAEVGGDALLEIARLSLHPVAIIGGVRVDDQFGPSIRYRVVGSDLYRLFADCIDAEGTP